MNKSYVVLVAAYKYHLSFLNIQYILNKPMCVLTAVSQWYCNILILYCYYTLNSRDSTQYDVRTIHVFIVVGVLTSVLTVRPSMLEGSLGVIPLRR